MSRWPSQGMTLAATPLILAACVSAGPPPTATVPEGTTLTTTSLPATTSPPTTTPTTSVPTTTGPSAEAFAAVAWEAGDQVWIVARLPGDGQTDCGEDTEEGVGCGPLQAVTAVSVPSGPHNVAAFGPTVLITHPGEGLVSRYDVETGEVVSALVGVEPHDVDFAPGGALAYVTDESGRRLVTIDPRTLETLAAVDLPGQAHDAVVDGDTIWVTMVGRSDLARVEGGSIELVEVGGSPHDLAMDGERRIWITHWNSSQLTVFDPGTGDVGEAPGGMVQPHHFASTPDGSLWITDNGAGSVARVAGDGPATLVTVGPTPHHLASFAPYLVVTVSGNGTLAVVDPAGGLVGEVPLGGGLHGVAVGEAVGVETG